MLSHEVVGFDIGLIVIYFAYMNVQSNLISVPTT